MHTDLPETVLMTGEFLEDLKACGALKLEDDLRRGWFAKALVARTQQARLAKAFDVAGPRHHEALGQLVGVVDPWIYEEMRRRYGRECWRDKRFRDDFFKANPEAAIRSRSKKSSFAVNGFRGNTQHPTPNTQHPMGARACTERRAA